ncbi:LysR family transcriptional regulator [Paracandidimonas soli]|uniref:DNA-binding transcriptional LysR family regulator n=1 Tax=Paracandidimonas soli TaxID=1917182 RepID=A0A4R3VFV6_9BURK|nr:LysR family transcriptional regulator [Paracandidimonas soli]TCV03131.1 DNA-binding transcriptional LysR family regulator [Paracandidimonas soli]
MELRQVEAFVSIATLRNFRAAANRLHITQPAISMRLASLEQELGVRLIDRSGSSVQLTPKGMQLLQLAEHLLDTSTELQVLASGEQKQLQRVRIGTTSTIVNAWIVDLFKEIARDLPHLTVELMIDTTPRLRSLLERGELDLAIIMGNTLSAGVRNLPLARYETQWVASRALHFPEEISLTEIAQHRIMTYAKDSATYGSIEELFRNNGLWPVRLSSTNSAEALLRIVKEGMCIGVVSSACVNASRDAESLQIIQVPSTLPAYEYVASYHMDSVGRVGMMVAEIAQRVCWSCAAGST